jgi:hypothetical protein
MRYSIIAAAIIGAVAAMPAAPASYGAEAAAPPAYGGETEQVYGTEVAPQMTSSAMPEATSTCTDEEENAVPYTSPAAMNAPPAYSAPAGSAGSSMMQSVPAMVSSASSPVSPEQTMPAGYASASMPAGSPSMSGPAGYASASMPAGSPMGSASASMPAGSAMGSSSMASPQMPAQSGPAGYASASMPAGSPMGSASASMPAGSASGSMASPDMPQQTGGYMSSPPQGETPKSPAGESAPAYGTAVVPGAAPTAAPYPVGGEQNMGYPAASGTAGAAMPTGTGSVGGTQEFEGAASSLNIAGLFVSFGAVAAFFM